MSTLSRWIRKMVPGAEYRHIVRRMRNRPPGNVALFPQALDAGALLIHIPKCAGLSVSEALYGPGFSPGHLRWMDYDPADLERHPGLEVFTVVRNPWDRLLSAYLFLLRGGLRERSSADVVVGRHLAAHHPGFPGFVRQFIGAGHARDYFHFEPQTDYLRDRSGGFPARIHRIRFESLEGSGALTLPSGRTLALPHRNRTPRASAGYREHYTPETRAIVAQAYAADIRELGYEF